MGPGDVEKVMSWSEVFLIVTWRRSSLPDSSGLSGAFNVTENGGLDPGAAYTESAINAAMQTDWQKASRMSRTGCAQSCLPLRMNSHASRFSLCPQSRHWIGARGAARRNITGPQCDHHDRNEHGRERERIGSANSVNQMAQHT